MTVSYVAAPTLPTDRLRQSPHLDELTRIATELWVTSSRRFVHAPTGEHRVPPARGAGGTADPTAAMRAALANLIYTRYYLGDIQGEQRATMGGPTLIADREDPVFGARLRNANTGQGYVDLGWTVTGVDGPNPVAPVTARKDGLTLRLRPDQIVAADASPIASGRGVGVRFPKDRAYALAGFYTAIGDAGSPAGADATTRWYVHLTPDAAPDLMADLTTGLNRLGVPFALKMLNHPAAYTRPDACVLYLPRATFAPTAPVVLAAYWAAGNRIRPRIPAFTRQVQPGLAIADEPHRRTQTVSFGQHRSRLIARGLVDAMGGRSRPTDRLDRIFAAFAVAGISVAAPHLNPGAPEYDFGSAMLELEDRGR